MKKSENLIFLLITVSMEFVANWIIWIHARKRRIDLMSKEEIDTEIKSRKTDIDDFVEALPNSIDAIETAEAEEAEIEKWRAAYERELATKKSES